MTGEIIAPHQPPIATGIYLESNSEAADNRILRRYLKSVLPGLILLMSHGTQLMWGLNLMPYNIASDLIHRPYEMPAINIIMIFVYYLGGIAGALIGAALVATIRKNAIYKICIFITLAASIFFATSNLHVWTLVAGRAIAGLGNSLTILTVLVHASEVASHQNYRHKVLLIVGLLLALSHLPPAIIVPRVTFELTNMLISVEYFMLALAAFAANSYYTKESPSFLLYRSNSSAETESQATYDLFKFLQTGPIPVVQLRTEYESLKAYVEAESSSSKSICADGNVKPLILCISIRLCSMLSFNFATCYNVILIQNLYAHGDNVSLTLISFYLICGSITTIFIYRNRHRLCSIVIGFASVHALIVIVMVVSPVFTDIYVNPWPVVIGILSGIIYVYCFAQPLDIMGWIIVSEAFALSKKPVSIAATIIVEHSLHIILIVLALFTYDLEIWITVVFGSLVFAWFSYYSLPRRTDYLALIKCPDAYKPLRA